MDLEALLGLIPTVVLLLSWSALAKLLGEGDARRGLLRATLLWAGYSVLVVELLSLVHGVTRFSLLLAWSLPAFLLLWLLLRRRSEWGPGPRTWIARLSRQEMLSYSLIGAICLATLLVAIAAPPSTWDSLNYHMPRIAHWKQLRAVEHFPTGIEIQNSMSPGAEMLVFHSYVLANGDEWVNLVQWLSMLTSLVGVSLLAGQLGAPKRGQALAALFAVTVPMAIVQASSTMTDFVVTAFVVTVASETMRFLGSPRLRLDNAIFLAVAASLAMLTKPTAYAYILPFALAAGYLVLRREGVVGTLRWGLLAVAFVLVFNGGHFIRNFRSFGNPISPPDRIMVLGSPWLGGRAFVSNLVRNVAMHTGTPSPHVNKGITIAVTTIHDWIGLEVNDPRTTAPGTFKIRWATTNEDRTTNPVHMWIIIFILVAIVIRPRKLPDRLFLYAALIVATFLTFSFIFKWQLYGGRFHLTFFVLMAPIVTFVALARLPRWLVSVSSIALVLSSWPWLLEIDSRPLLSLTGNARVQSVLTASRRDLYFANAKSLEDPYRSITAAIRNSNCRSVRFRLGGGAPEYLLWKLLVTRDREMDIGWRVSSTGALQDPEDLDLACAVICEDCASEGESYDGLELRMVNGGISLYLNAE